MRDNPENIKVISKAGEIKAVTLPKLSEDEFTDQQIAGLAFDDQNNLYVVRWLKKLTRENGEVTSYVLYVLDNIYNVKQEWMLHFLEMTDFELVRIAKNRNNNVIMIKFFDPYVYVYGSSGKLKHKFEHDSAWPPNFCISKQKEVIASVQDDQTLHIYSEAGNLKSAIELPEGHEVYA